MSSSERRHREGNILDTSRPFTSMRGAAQTVVKITVWRVLSTIIHLVLGSCKAVMTARGNPLADLFDIALSLAWPIISSWGNNIENESPRVFPLLFETDIRGPVASCLGLWSSRLAKYVSAQLIRSLSQTVAYCLFEIPLTALRACRAWRDVEREAEENHTVGSQGVAIDARLGGSGSGATLLETPGGLGRPLTVNHRPSLSVVGETLEALPLYNRLNVRCYFPLRDSLRLPPLNWVPRRHGWARDSMV
ncbi:hypothetical protein FA13DRAFT_1711964 [Coprinellus micaceus]|uniref:Uncharacterized protein n=1 Tax=Coprinellus micaceus TaxID=71717 RepID=A0A4Y7T3K3_COPMI|nr:hypothetical protein FA13DRAFT_1711964 [Coprinellus micaceus]